MYVYYMYMYYEVICHVLSKLITCKEFIIYMYIFKHITCHSKNIERITVATVHVATQGKGHEHVVGKKKYVS